ncbi:hypothetical protein EC988_009706, partial [Linderina pennispora]
MIESARQDRHLRSLNEATNEALHDTGVRPAAADGATSTNTPTTRPTQAGNDDPSSASISAQRHVGRRAHWLMYTSQRVAAERVLLNPRAGREARQEAMRTLATLREQDWNAVAGASSNETSATSRSTTTTASQSPLEEPIEHSEAAS